MLKSSLPISVVIPTKDRPAVLEKTLLTFASQTLSVSEVIIIDASATNDTKDVVTRLKAKFPLIVYLPAKEVGAAAQRNQGVAESRFPFVLFADDDVYLDIDCVSRLWEGIAENESVGAISAMIKNQRYLPMGRISMTLAYLLSGKRLTSYAGKLLVPGWGLLPEDLQDMPEIVEVEWVNLGATIYRKEALPSPPFPSHFKGYSLMEDTVLSAWVARKWKLKNARTARIYHDSQPGDHKKNLFLLSRMEIVNRHFLMTQIMRKSDIKSYLRLVLFELFGVASNLRSLKAWLGLPSVIVGKCMGVYDILVR